MSAAWEPSPELVDTAAGRWMGYVKRFMAAAGSGTHRYGLIRDGDSVLVGLSGGKDSLALLLFLELRRRRVKDRYTLKAARVDWGEPPAAPEDEAALAAFCAWLGVPFFEERRPMPESLAERGLSCYACSRERRRVLFELAEREGCGVVALGHHLDDFAETALMNVCKHGRLDPMRPQAVFFGRFRLVRPLCEARESALRAVATRLGLPVVRNRCPLADSSQRRAYKAALAELAKIDTLVRENVCKAASMAASPPEESHGDP
ncbi:MAG TPA: tRNA 2-thiocytidine biosynthesis TtcA family protein [Spirochaetales bacterium]|nr:tRNA 2-thiocytidine biosynthesis TtcA family protein [Spirochaetales bacterium]